MTMTSWGYNGTIDEAQWAQMSEFFGTRHAVARVADWALTGVPNERQVAIAPGIGYGHGVADSSDAPVALQVPAPTETVGRWHLVVARRDWSKNDTSFAIIAGPGTTGTTPTVPPATYPAELNEGPGTLDDQPLGWAWVKTSSTNLVLFDLRTFPIGDTIKLIPGQVTAALAALNIPGQVSNYFQESPAVLAVAVTKLTTDARAARDQAQVAAAAAAADRAHLDALVITDLGTTDSQTAALLGSNTSLASKADDARTLAAGLRGGVLENIFAGSPVGPNPTPRQLRRSRTALAAAFNRAGFFNYMCIGDSITAGAGANGDIGTHSFPERLAQMLALRGYPDAGSGFVWPSVNLLPANPPGPDARWMFSGGFAAPGGNESGFVSATAVNALARFDCGHDSNNVSFFYGENSGNFRYRIEGTGAVWVNVFGSDATKTTWKEVVISGLATGRNILQIENLNAQGAHIGPARAWLNSGGVLVNNAAVAGSVSTTWRSDATWFKNGPLAMKAGAGLDLVIIESMMVNDITVGITPAQHKANLENIVAWAKLVGAPSQGQNIAPSEVIIWAPPPTSGVSIATRKSYIDVIRQVAAAADVLFIDMADRFGATYEEYSGLQVMSDNAHPNSRGYTDIAAAFLPLLVP